MTSIFGKTLGSVSGGQPGTEGKQCFSIVCVCTQMCVCLHNTYLIEFLPNLDISSNSGLFVRYYIVTYFSIGCTQDNSMHY